MTQTLTTDELRQIVDSHEKGYGMSVPINYGYLAARELLANREAQPVLYASEETLAYAKEGEKSLVTWSEPMGDAVIPLFTAPPAPAVPDEITAPLGAIANGYQLSIAQAEGYRWGWNAFRAAMLNHSEVALDMVEPSPAMQDGWIACSERMPDDGENIITLNSSGGIFGGYVFKHGVFVDAEEEYRQDDTITHWMPLPAAPEVDKNA